MSFQGETRRSGDGRAGQSANSDRKPLGWVWRFFAFCGSGFDFSGGCVLDIHPSSRRPASPSSVRTLRMCLAWQKCMGGGAVGQPASLNSTPPLPPSLST